MTPEEGIQTVQAEVAWMGPKGRLAGKTLLTLAESGSGNMKGTVATDRAFLAAAADLGR